MWSLQRGPCSRFPTQPWPRRDVGRALAAVTPREAGEAASPPDKSRSCLGGGVAARGGGGIPKSRGGPGADADSLAASQVSLDHRATSK